MMELWTGGRIAGAMPQRQLPGMCIEIWFNWVLVGCHKSYMAAEQQINEYLNMSQTAFGDIINYIKIS